MGDSTVKSNFKTQVTSFDKSLIEFLINLRLAPKTKWPQNNKNTKILKPVMREPLTLHFPQNESRVIDKFMLF